MTDTSRTVQQFSAPSNPTGYYSILHYVVVSNIVFALIYEVK